MTDHYDNHQCPNADNYNLAQLEQMLLDDLSNIIARHANWLDGRTFQRLCQRVTEAHFERSDLDIVVNHQEALSLNLIVSAALDKAAK